VSPRQTEVERLPSGSNSAWATQYVSRGMAIDDATLIALIREIAGDGWHSASRTLEQTPALGTAALRLGATRGDPDTFFVDTALHGAAAAYRSELIDELVALGGDVRAKNRRGATPLHYSADGGPNSRRWDPDAQHDTIVALVRAGAEVNAVDKSGVAPLHRAVRTRCTPAVRALLDHGADPNLPNGSGSTPMQLAEWTTGKGGSGTPEAKAQQEEIIGVLGRHGAS
jgi:ankyrin repeat protein